MRRGGLIFHEAARCPLWVHDFGIAFSEVRRADGGMCTISSIRMQTGP